MNQTPEPQIRVRVDPTNPGQFFACCGLLELADRLWNGAEGWFEQDGCQFSFRPHQADTTNDYTPAEFLNKIAQCRLANTMTESQLMRRNELTVMPKKKREEGQTVEDEKKNLDKLWREEPVILHAPINLRIDWFADEHAGGGVFKTWAGQQSVIDIAQGMKSPLDADELCLIHPKEWMGKKMLNDTLPFNFDSELGGLGSDRDVGFSFDPLKTIRVQTRPLLEFFAFVGLQRFRPLRINAENRYRFFLWFDPLLPEVASTAACGLLTTSHTKTFEFRLHYRTKYLKSFLPATPIKRS